MQKNITEEEEEQENLSSIIIDWTGCAVFSAYRSFLRNNAWDSPWDSVILLFIYLFGTFICFKMLKLGFHIIL